MTVANEAAYTFECNLATVLHGNLSSKNSAHSKQKDGVEVDPIIMISGRPR